MPFKPIELEWKGQTYTLPPTRVLRTIEAVEEVVTLGELATDAARGKVKLARLSRAFGILLRAAGAPPTDDEVFDGMGFAEGGAVKAADAAVQTLLMLLIPPSAFEEAKTRSAPQGNAAPTAASPSKRSGSRSARSGSGRRNSGT